MNEAVFKPQLFSQRFLEALRGSHRLLIATHTNPDGDALASVAACMKVFSKLVPRCDCFADRYDGDYLKQLPFLDKVYTRSSDVQNEAYDLVLCVDAHSLSRVNLPPSIAARSFAIDHHPQERAPIVQEPWIDTGYPSATAMLLRFFQELGVNIDAQTASILLCGVITDTELFQNHAANAIAYRSVATLTSLGADITTMKRFGLNAIDFWTIKSMGTVLQRILVNQRYRAGAVVLDEASELKEVLAGVVKRTRMPETMFVIKTKPSSGRVEVSLRSANKNVGALARLLGGGGHARAAAFRFAGRLVEQDEKMVIL